jgi:hypothetical protein
VFKINYCRNISEKWNAKIRGIFKVLQVFINLMLNIELFATRIREPYEIRTKELNSSYYI